MWPTIDFNIYLDIDRDIDGDNLTRIKDGEYVINLDDKQCKGTHWVSLFIDRNTIVFFDSFRIEYIPQQLWNKSKDKSIIFRIQSDDSIMSGFCCIAFIE